MTNGGSTHPPREVPVGAASLRGHSGRDIRPMTDSETVYVVLNPSGGSQGKMHIYKDCPRLAVSDKDVLEKPKSMFEAHRTMCKWCTGESNPGSDSDPMERRDLLLETDKDAVGP